MLKNSAAARASRSVRHASMFCTTYPPPPGSAPGYHDDHQLSPRSAASVIVGMTQTPAPVAGQKESTASALPNVVASPAGCAAGNFDSSTSIPPTAFHATTASTIAPPIPKQYCIPSVAATPQQPETAV